MKFNKRTTAPSVNDVCYYGNKNTMVNYGYGLPNCTTYVHGRFAELGADESKLCLGDAKYYYNNTTDGFKRSATPKVGAIACYNGGTYGHVAIVEEVYDNGTMLISESDYVQKIAFRTRVVGKKENVYGYALQGFILCPVEFEEESKQEIANNKYKIGDRVIFSTCYSSSTDTVDKAIPVNRMARNYGTITRIVDARNPYLLDDGLCWVNDGDIRGYVENEITYTVQAGDTLSAIGQKYGKDFDEIAAKNGIVDPNYIQVGQVLKI